MTRAWNAEKKKVAQQKHKENHPSRYHHEYRLRFQGWPEEEIKKATAAWESFDGICQGCGQPDCARRRFEIDHDHLRMKFRGILGNGCNRAIGMVSESPARLRALADYLERSA